MTLYITIEKLYLDGPTGDPSSILAALATLRELLTTIATTQVSQEALLMTIKSTLDEARAELAAANTTTTEIAADVADLVQRAVNAEANSAEATAVLADAKALSDRLRGVASTYTPPADDPPTDI